MDKIVGYGVCGPNEPHLDETLQEFERLCDEVVICTNNATEKEKNLIDSYGFDRVEDNREWGVLQWKIKEDFIKQHVAPRKPSLCICLDMDEVFDSQFTKEDALKLLDKPFDAFYFYIINLWDDGFAPARSFWNIRAWKFKPEYGLEFPKKNVHCGLAPQWVWSRGYYTKYFLKHYGLQTQALRKKKVKRYKKYDPNQKFVASQYYDSLDKNLATEPYDEEAIREGIWKHLSEIEQKAKPRMNTQQKPRYATIRLKQGGTVQVPADKLPDYTRQGHEFVEYYEDIEEKIQDILETKVAEAPKKTGWFGK